MNGLKSTVNSHRQARTSERILLTSSKASCSVAFIELTTDNIEVSSDGEVLDPYV